MKRLLTLFVFSCFVPTVVLAYNTDQDSLQALPLPQVTLCVDSLQHRNSQDFNDLLWMMPGIWVRDLGTAGQWAEPHIQGSTTAQVTILWDDLYLNDLWTGRADLNLIPPGMVSTIKSLSTTDNLAYFDLGSTLLFQNAQPKTIRPYTKIYYQTGNNYSNTDVLFSQQLTERWQFVSGVRLLKYGSDDVYESSNVQKHQGQTVFSELTFQMTENWKWTYHILSNKNRSNLPYHVPSVLDTTIIENPRLKRERTDHALSLNGTWNQIQNTCLLQRTSDTSTLRNRTDNSETPMKSNMNRIHWHMTLPFRIPVKSGFDFSQFSYSVKDTNTTKKWTHHTFRSWLSLTYPITSTLQVTGKMTMYHEKSMDVEPLYLSAIQYQACKQGALSFSYQTAHRVLSPVEKFGLSYLPVPAEFYRQTVFFESDLPVVSNPNLKPETGDIAQLRFRWIGAHQSLAICTYHRNVINLIEPGIANEGLAYYNTEKHHFTGFDAALNLTLWKGIGLESIFNYVKTEDDAGSSLLERPYTWGNAALFWKHSFFESDLQTMATVGIRYWSDFHTLTQPFNTSQIYAYQLASYALDAKLVLIFMKYGTMGLSFDNILDRQIYLVDSLALRGRVFRFDFSWELFD